MAIKLNWRKSETHGLEADPEPREIRYTLFSADDHLVEPPGMFEGRLPSRLQDLAPRVVETEEGHEVWEFEGQTHYQVGMNAVAGRRAETVRVEPFRFDQMRPGCWQPQARLEDMTINHVEASLSFPNYPRFCGQIFLRGHDKELSKLCVEAYND